MWVPFTLFLLWSVAFPLSGQPRKLYLQASNLKDDRPLAGVEFSLKEPHSSTTRTDSSGKAEILISAQIKAGNWVEFVIKSEGYVMISPWNGRALVPPFDPTSEFFVPVWLYRTGDQIQAKDKLIISWAQKVTSQSVPKVIDRNPTPAQVEATRAAIAKQLGLLPADLQRLLSRFSSRDPYEQGMIALADRRYTEAIRLLSEALETLTKKQDPGGQEKLVNAALFLGHANYLLGNYREAANAYRRAAGLVSDDGDLLNTLGIALERAQDLKGAEPLFRRTLAIKEQEIKEGRAKPESEDLAASLTNLGSILNEKQNCGEAEPLVLHALRIWVATLPGNDPRLATAYRNVVTVLSCRGDYARATSYFEKELSVWAEVWGRDHPEYAAKLYEFAKKMHDVREYDIAERLLKQALKIWGDRGLQNNAPAIRTMRILGDIRASKKDFAAAESYYMNALHAHEDAGSGAAFLVEILDRLDELYQAQGDLGKAENVVRRIVQILREKLPERRGDIATALTNLGILLYNRKDYQNAERYFNEALPLAKEHLGADNSIVVTIQRALDNIRKVSADRMNDKSP